MVSESLVTLRVVGLDGSAAEGFGPIDSALERAGSILAGVDRMIASIALVQAASLVTGNRKHYDRSNIAE